MKKGFTLAEVLITLAIIGVVAALAAPALMSAVQKSKVGPTLRKFVSTMENANEHMLADNDSDTILAIGDGASLGQGYLNRLSKYAKGSRKSGAISKIYKNSGSEYDIYGGDTISDAIFEFTDGSSIYITSDNYTPLIAKNAGGAYKGTIGLICYDINGFKTPPNKLGKDVFIFHLDNSGTIIPKGGKAAYAAYSNVTKEKAWAGECDNTTITAGENCAGSVADNDWKVIYKY